MSSSALSLGAVPPLRRVKKVQRRIFDSLVAREAASFRDASSATTTLTYHVRAYDPFLVPTTASAWFGGANPDASEEGGPSNSQTLLVVAGTIALCIASPSLIKTLQFGKKLAKVCVNVAAKLTVGLFHKATPTPLTTAHGCAHYSLPWQAKEGDRYDKIDSYNNLQYAAVALLPSVGKLDCVLSSCRYDQSQEGLAAREDKYAELVNSYYDLATEFYEWGWGTSFHFAEKKPGEDFHSSILRHEHYLAGRLGVAKGTKLLDCGCGVGGRSLRS